MIPPAYDEQDLPERLRRLLALEVDRVVDDLDLRRDFLVDSWGRHRDRGPFIDTMFTRWNTLAMTDLALIDAEAMVACEAFHRELDELRMYMRFTGDMPATLQERFDRALARLKVVGALAIERLGGVPERPVFAFDDDSERGAAIDPVPALEVIEGEEE